MHQFPQKSNGAKVRLQSGALSTGKLTQEEVLQAKNCFKIGQLLMFQSNVSSFQINQITHWLDSSNVYGSDDEEAATLRLFRDGLLTTTPSAFRGKMPLLPEDPDNEECRATQPCFVAGEPSSLAAVRYEWHFS